MQEIVKSREANRLTTASNRSYWRIQDEMLLFNDVSVETFRMILDEEKTHAAEILAQHTKNGDIPRVYYYKDNDLIDGHGISLSKVLDSGIEALGLIENQKLGYEWELRRRYIERDNLTKLFNLGIGQIAIEISPTDLTKSREELMNFGYTGCTLARVTLREDFNRFVQRNIILNGSSLSSINEIRQLIDNSSVKVKSAEEALSSISFIYGGKEKVNEIASMLKVADANNTNLKSPLSFIKQIFKDNYLNKNNAWDFIEDNEDVLVALVKSFKNLHPADSTDKNLDSLRAGAWKILIERYNGKSLRDTDVLAGKNRAVESKDTFIACGGSIDFSSSSKLPDRISTYSLLTNTLNGYGDCSSCGDKDFLYGCGVFCFYCNNTWCEEYLYSGKQLSNKEIKEIRYLKYLRLY